MDYFPTLDNVALSTSSQDADRTRYTLQFDVLARNHSQLARGMVVQIMEGPEDGSGQHDGTIHDWFFVYSPAGGTHTDRGTDEIRKRYQISSEVRADSRRRLVIVNRLRGGTETRTQPFTVLDVR